MAQYPASVAAYGKPGGGNGTPATRSCLRDLGRTLRAIATKGPNAFYTGWIADSIAATMARNGGLISKRDLAAYQAKIRTPVRGTYRGYELISMPPPSSGGVAMIEMLNILEQFDLPKLGDDVARRRCTRDRSDAARLSRSRALPRRSGFREDAASRG